MIKKHLLTAALVLALFGTLLLAGSSPAVADGTVITVWHALPGENSPLFEQIINTYPNKTKGLVRLDIRRFETPYDLHQALLSGKEKPNVALIDTRWQEEIDQVSKIVYMEDLIKEKVGNSVYIVFKMDTFPQMWKSSKNNDKLMSMPFTGFNRALIVNNDVLAKYTKKRPKVWKDFITINKEIAKKKGECESDDSNSWTFLIPSNGTPEELAEFYQVMLWQTNRGIFEPFMDGELVAFDGPEGKYVLGLMVDLIHKHRVSPPVKVDKSQVGMFIGTPREYLKMKEQGIDVQVVRWPGNKTSRNNLTVYGFVVFEGADKQKMDKIWHLIYDASEFESSTKWALQTPFLPQNKQVTLSPGFFAYIKGYPGIKRFVQQLKNARVAKMSIKKAKVMKILGENIRMCLNNRISVDKCIEASAQHANLIMDPEGHLRAKKEQMKSISGYVDKVWEKDY